MIDFYTGIYNYSMSKEEVKNRIMEILSDGQPHRCGEMALRIGVTCQRVTVLIQQLLIEDKVIRHYVKGRVREFEGPLYNTNHIIRYRYFEKISLYMLREEE